MKLKLVLGTLAALFAMAVPAGAVDISDRDSPETYWWAPDLRCEDYSLAEKVAAHGVISERFPTPNPDMFVEIHLYCVVDEINEVLPATDCTATAYSLTGWFWNVPYNAQWDTTNSYGLSASTVLSTMTAAGNTWDIETAADIFGSMTQGGSSKNIRRQDFVNQQGFKGLGGGGTIAVTYTWAYQDGRAAESDAAYNTFFAWGVNGEANKMDLQGIGTHEMGHTFGLGHSSTASQNQCLTMYPYGAYGETHQRTLGDGDILGIEDIYGA